MSQERPAPDPDAADARALRAGEESALERLMERHGEPLYRFILRALNDRERARELAQEAFTKAYFSIAQYDGRGSFKGWLYRIAQNLVRDTLKSRAYRNARRTDSMEADAVRGDDRAYALPAALVEERTAAAQAQDQETLRTLRTAIAQLPEDLKAAFILAALEELPHQECAAILGLSAKAVEMRVYKARKRLREVLEAAQNR